MTMEVVRGNRGEFAQEAQNSFTLPSRYYTDPQVLKDETRKIFQRSWLYFGHVTDLSEPGSYFTEELAGQPVLAIRGQDDEIRVFYNICQHRGHLLLEGRGVVNKRIVCPYHAWCFGLDGALEIARLTKDVPDFDRADFSLKAVPHAIVAGMIFINFDPEAKPEDGELGAFEETLLANLPDMPDYVASNRLGFDVAANWKVVVDNFSEGYHIPIAHPELHTLYNEQGGAAQVSKRFGFYQKKAKAGYGGFETTGDEPYLTWFLWPNLCLLSLPGSDHLVVLRIMPGEAGTSVERADIYSPRGDSNPNRAVVETLFAEMFNKEDIALVQSVQKGLSSLGYDQGRYVADRAGSWFSESGLHWFHKQILEALAQPD